MGEKYFFFFYPFSSIHSSCQVFLSLLSIVNALADCSNVAYSTIRPSISMYIFSFLLLILLYIFKLDQACFYASYSFQFFYTLQLSSVTVVSLSFHQLRCKKDNLERWEDMEWEVRMRKASSKSFPHILPCHTALYKNSLLW